MIRTLCISKQGANLFPDQHPTKLSIYPIASVFLHSKVQEIPSCRATVGGGDGGSLSHSRDRCPSFTVTHLAWCSCREMLVEARQPLSNQEKQMDATLFSTARESQRALKFFARLGSICSGDGERPWHDDCSNSRSNGLFMLPCLPPDADHDLAVTHIIRNGDSPTVYGRH